MLCGVGGRTIEEAQQCLSYEEYISWVKYRNLRGTLNNGMRIERGSALLAKLYSDHHSKKGSAPSFYDFAPHHDEPEMSLEEAMESWR